MMFIINSFNHICQNVWHLFSSIHWIWFLEIDCGSYTWSEIKSRIKNRPKTKVPNLKNQDWLYVPVGIWTLEFGIWDLMDAEIYPVCSITCIRLRNVVILHSMKVAKNTWKPFMKANIVFAMIKLSLLTFCGFGDDQYSKIQAKRTTSG